MTKLSLITILVTSTLSTAMAEVKYDVGGESVFYYQTNNSGDTDFFNQKNSSASVGLELDANADLGNDLLLGVQGTFLGTLGLEKGLISNSRQNAKINDRNDVALTKLYASKKLANTFVKVGRQELSSSYSPLAFSEGWNVFTNRFDALLMSNNDLSNTTLTGAYIHASNRHNGLNTFDDLSVNSASAVTPTLNNGAYLLTVANESMKNVPIIASYYNLRKGVNGDNGQVLWLDVKVKQNAINMAFQAGQLDTSSSLKETNAIGAKVYGKVSNVDLSLAYSSVNNGDVSLQNIGTGIKTPLYTQMIGNQNFISSDANSVVLKGSTKLGEGKFIAQYDYTKDGSVAKNNYQELDLIYKFKALNTNMILAYIRQKTANNSFTGNSEKVNNNLRFWTRYNF
jgi:hypothetical protein